MSDKQTSETTAPQSSVVGRYAIFTRGGRPRKMHAVRPGENQTICRIPIGAGSGLVRDGDYRDNVPCGTCWSRP